MITLKNVGVEFPIYNADARSLKNSLIRATTGGKIGAGANGGVVVRALSNINLTIHNGERIGLIGHNGAGKSTLLRVLGGIYEPNIGELRIHGEVSSLIDISLGIDAEATGRENIYIRGGLLGMTHKQIKKHVEDIIDFSELGDFIDMPIRTYSTGMHLRLAFAISTVIRPDILIMDEWLSVGDAAFKRKAEERMTALVKATNILIIASHSKELILDNCSRVIWLEHGEIKMDGKPQEVIDRCFQE